MKDTEFTSTEFDGNGWKFDLNELLGQVPIVKSKEEADLFGLKISINPLVPKNEIWFVDSRGTISKIINIGNSKLYRFILWWQNLVGKIKVYFHKLAELQQEAIKFQNDMENELWKDKK